MGELIALALVPSILQLTYFSIFHFDADIKSNHKTLMAICACLLLPLIWLAIGALASLYGGGNGATAGLAGLLFVPGCILGLITGLFFGVHAASKGGKGNGIEPQ